MSRYLTLYICVTLEPNGYYLERPISKIETKLERAYEWVRKSKQNYFQTMKINLENTP